MGGEMHKCAENKSNSDFDLSESQAGLGCQEGLSEWQSGGA